MRVELSGAKTFVETSTTHTTATSPDSCSTNFGSDINFSGRVVE